MSRTINKVILVGNVGRDPHVYETKEVTKAVHLSLATDRPRVGAAQCTGGGSPSSRLAFLLAS